METDAFKKKLKTIALRAAGAAARGKCAPEVLTAIAGLVEKFSDRGEPGIIEGVSQDDLEALKKQVGFLMTNANLDSPGAQAPWHRRPFGVARKSS